MKMLGLNTKHIIAITLKEWREYKNDRMSLLLSIFLPLISLILFGYGIRLEAKNVPIIVIDNNYDAVSRDFTRRLFATGTFVHAQPETKPLRERGNSLQLLRQTNAKAVIVLPPGLQRQIQTKQNSHIDAVIDGSDINTALAIPNVLDGVVADFLADHTQPDLQNKYTIPTVATMFNPSGDEGNFIVTGVYGIILWLFPSLLAAVSASRETDQQTIIRLYSSGLSAAEYILGKAVFFIGLGIAEACVMFPLSYLLFHGDVSRGLLVVTLPTVIYIGCAVMFGLLVGTTASSQTVAVQTTSTGGFFPTLLLSGFVYPTSNVPFPLNLVSYLVPAKYYIELMRYQLIKQLPLSMATGKVAILVLFLMVLFVLTWRPLRRMQLKDRG